MRTPASLAMMALAGAQCVFTQALLYADRPPDIRALLERWVGLRGQRSLLPNLATGSQGLVCGDGCLALIAA